MPQRPSAMVYFLLILPPLFWAGNSVLARGIADLVPPVVAGFLYLSIFPSILAYLYWNRGVREIGANRAGLYINLIPLFAALLAIALLGERFKSFHLVGTLLICSGLLLFNLPTKITKGSS